MTGFDLFGMYVLNILSQTVALLGVHFGLTLESCHSGCLVLAISSFLSSLVQRCCCLRGLLFDGSDTNDALWMVIILLYQDVLASA